MESGVVHFIIIATYKVYIFVLLLLMAAGLYQAAMIKEDQQLILVFKSSDAVACEVHYHASCHRTYLNSVTNKLR